MLPIILFPTICNLAVYSLGTLNPSEQFSICSTIYLMMFMSFNSNRVVASSVVKTVYPFGTHEFTSVSLCGVRVAQSWSIDFLFTIVFTSSDHPFGICKLFLYPIAIKIGPATLEITLV
jgi:hypothetical protein